MSNDDTFLSGNDFKDLAVTFGFDFHIVILVRAAVILFILILLYPGVARLLFGTSLSQDTCPITWRRHNVREDCYISERTAAYRQ